MNLAMFLGHDALGLSESLAVRLSLLSAGVWWAGFTSSRSCGCAATRRWAWWRPGAGSCSAGSGSCSCAQGLRSYPMTLTFLVAFLFYNDGIQTVIGVASTYGAKQLGFGQSVLIATILVIQFVAFGGAMAFGWLAGQVRLLPLDPLGHLGLDGDRRARGVPARRQRALSSRSPWPSAVFLGGTQALSRSFFSLLIPRGRAGEYFALYNACERGTSWFGTFLFGVVFQVTGSYRPAIVALIVFFVLGRCSCCAWTRPAASGRPATPSRPWSSRPARRRADPDPLGPGPAGTDRGPDGREEARGVPGMPWQAGSL